VEGFDMKLIALASAVLLSPVIALANAQACSAPPPYPANYSREASNLMDTMRYDAQRVADHAFQLQNYTRELNLVDWTTHSYQLNRIRSEVDDMGKRLCTLESIQSVTVPKEQQLVAQVAPLVQELADNATDAIHYLNAHQNDFWNPAYRAYTHNMYTEAREISHTINQNEHMTHVRQKEAALEQELGGK
jgi:hypothetical protein